MGNILKICCAAPTTSDESPGHHGVSVGTVGVSALAQDLLHFEATSQVPEGLKNHVVSAKKAQANWYTKLLKAWKEAKPSPKTPEDASRLIFHTLRGHRRADVEGLLTFYGLPTTTREDVKFELHTLPVDAEAVADGDTITVYVSTSDPRESSCVPRDVKVAAAQRSKAQADRNNREADALYKRITDSGYRVIPVQNKEVLARKYRIRLRGIDAPESSMPYGKEARDELVKLVQGKCLRVLVYTEDRYGRCIGDIYCNGILAQEMMLKKGLAWHYKAYDRQPELANWEAEARAKRIGLWASRNPEEPWVYRKNQRDGIKTSDEK